tara:strand:- start:338 stop:796 length:459 start_codon:yes stop_codon:yes gene_type:complete
MSKRAVNLLRAAMSPVMKPLGQRLPVEVIDGNITLTAADSGKRYTIGSATAAVTLPTVAVAGSGWYCEFWVNDNTAATTITAPGTDLILGNVRTGADNATPQLMPATVIGTEVLVFTTSAVQGDFARLFCDGTNYFITGMSRVAEGITLAAE